MIHLLTTIGTIMMKRTQRTRTNTSSTREKAVANKETAPVAEETVKETPTPQTKEVVKEEPTSKNEKVANNEPVNEEKVYEPKRSGVDTYADILVLLNSDDVEFRIKQELLSESKIPFVTKIVSKFNYHTSNLGASDINPSPEVVLSGNHDIMTCITDVLASTDDEEFNVMFLLINMYFTEYGGHGQSLSLPMLTRYDYLSTKSKKYIRTYNLLTALIVKLAPYPTRKERLKTINIKTIFTPENSTLTQTMINNLIRFYTA